ncbi:unnamed protein product, partial [Laminaria digitata]
HTKLVGIHLVCFRSCRCLANQPLTNSSKRYLIPPLAVPASFRQAYMSPEQVGAEGTLDYTTKVDSWGLGVIAYELLHDKMPFR